jgi:hypothetical protein
MNDGNGSMSRRWCAGLLGLLVIASAGACRTRLDPYVKPEPKTVYVGEKGCDVYDFASAADIPEGAKNLGWVTVPYTGNDDDTFIKLRQKICELGGNALSQPSWDRDSMEGEPNLKANAWALP